MTRPTDDDLDYAENADVGSKGCLFPNGEACPEDTEGDTDSDD